MRPDLVFAIFVPVWITLSVVVWLFYWKGKVATKRRFHPYIVIAGALVFLGFVTAIMPASSFVVLVPAVAFISFLNYKMTKFCGSCGRTLIQNPPWQPMQQCSKCGAALG